MTISKRILRVVIFLLLALLMYAFLDFTLRVLLIILYIILGILAITLAIVLAVLFVPIRYTVESEKKIDGGITASAYVSWLLKIFSLRYFFDMDNKINQLIVKVFGFEFDILGDEEEESEDDDKAKMSPQEDEKKEKDDPIREPPPPKPPPTESAHTKGSSEKGARKKDREAKSSVIKEISLFLKKVSIREVIAESIDLIKKIFKILKPTIFRLNVLIGRDDPYITGLIIALTSSFGFLTPSITVAGDFDFDEEVFGYELFARGKVRIGKLMWCVLTYGPVRRLIKEIIREIFKRFCDIIFFRKKLRRA